MATATFYESSFSQLLWQNVVDVNAELIDIPGSGFAFENVGGTFTVFLGEDVVVTGGNPPVSGTVTEILYLTSIAIGSEHARIVGSFDASSMYEAYRGGGDAFFATVFSGNDTIEIDGPPSLGALDQSPLIEAYAGDDGITGSAFADTIFAGAGNDTVEGRGGADEIHAGPGLDFIFGGNGDDELFGGDDDFIDHLKRRRGP
jgi:Ca2+-binding RTX toxin-like protein